MLTITKTRSSTLSYLTKYKIIDILNALTASECTKMHWKS